MKKIRITASLLMVFIFLGSAGAFVEKRHQWWEVRLKNLTAEKTQLQKKNIMDPQVLGIIDKEMNRARDIIAVFESEMRDDGSLTHEARTMTDDDISAEARNTVPPLFALSQLEALVDTPGNSAAARTAVEKRLQTLVQASFGEKSPDLVQRIMESDITRNEWQNLAVEYFIGTLMASRKAMEDHAVADVAARVSLALKEKNNITNSRELRLLTIKHTIEYLGECNAHEVSPDSAALQASWAWRRLETSLARDFSACRRIIAMLRNPAGTHGAVSLERIMYYHRNPADLESLLFRGQRPQQAAARSGALGTDRRMAGAVMMEIPAPLNTADIMDDMDKMRRGAIAAVTGREDERYLDSLGKNLTAIIQRHCAAVKNKFFREEERVRLLRKKEGGSIIIANEQEFLEAQKAFQAALAIVEDYGKKSEACIAIVSDGRKIDSGAIVEHYRYRLQRDEEYLRHAVYLATESSRLSFIEDPRVHKLYSGAMSRIGSFFNFIAAGLALERNDQTHLTKRDMGTIRELKSGFISTINSARGHISSAHGNYLTKRSSTAGTAKKNRESLKGTIAQDEIDGLYRHAVECVELFEHYRYGEKSLYRYADLYRDFLKQARTNAPSEALGNSLKMNSLLVSLDTFDSARVARELAAKHYLQKEAKASLARLATLLEFYKKNNVTLKDAPQPAEITALEKRIAITPLVKIDSWVMNESNFQEIDKKAARKLSLILNRKDLLSVGTTPRDGKNHVQPLPSITIREPELSLILPRGWEEETIGETETYLGIVKSFHSGDGSSTVRLVKLALDNGAMKDAAEEWIVKSGSSLVEKRWVKAGDVDCLWILSRDRHNNISETCSISKDGYAVLISGKTSRDRYAAFKIQFKKIINSLQMETL